MHIRPVHLALIAQCAALCGAHFHMGFRGTADPVAKPTIHSLSSGNLPRSEALFVRDPDSGNIEDVVAMTAGESIITFIPTVTSPWYSAYQIDYGVDGIFNPAVISIPSALSRDGQRRIFAFGRKWCPKIVMNEKSYLSTMQVGCFLERVHTSHHQQRPYMRCVATMKTLDLPPDIAAVNARIVAKKSLYWDDFLGAEDARVVWTDSGAPVMVYGQTSTRLDCSRTMFVIDARVAFPRLKTIMIAGKRSPPILFDKPTELIAPTRNSAVEKNWVIFFIGDVMYAQVTIVPRFLVRHYSNGYTSDNIIPEGRAQKSHCVYQMFRDSSVILHQATNALKVTLCNRNECTPSVSNTVFMSIFHRVFYGPRFYERFVATWNITEPFEYVSMSKRMEYIGINQDKLTFTTTLSYRDDTPDISQGYLDSLVLISIGTNDNAASLAVTEASRLLDDHIQCL